MNNRTNLLTEEYLKACRRDAEQYAQFCFHCLVDRYEADPEEINFEDIVEGTLGYLIICILGNERPMIPDKYVEMDLAKRSDFGLDNMGLTRAKYDKVIVKEKILDDVPWGTSDFGISDGEK